VDLVHAVPDATCPTLLRALLVERHWQTPKTFRTQFMRAASELAEREGDPALRTLDVSERQGQGWLDGAQPRPDACRVLELMFGHPVARLLGPAQAGPAPDVVRPDTPQRGGAAAPQAAADMAAVQVSVSPGMAVTVVRDDDAPGRVAVIAGAVRVLI